jgi:hypothetical protein
MTNGRVNPDRAGVKDKPFSMMLTKYQWMRLLEMMSKKKVNRSVAMRIIFEDYFRRNRK